MKNVDQNTNELILDEGYFNVRTKFANRSMMQFSSSWISKCGLFELIRRLFSFFLSWLWVELGVWRTTRMPTFWIRFETRNVCFLAPRENWEREFVSQQGFTRLPDWLSLLKFGVFIENLAICVRFIRGPSCCWAENCFVNTKTVFAILFWNKSSQFV